jgi:hypothetical protein
VIDNANALNASDVPADGRERYVFGLAGSFILAGFECEPAEGVASAVRGGSVKVFTHDG